MACSVDSRRVFWIAAALFVVSLGYGVVGPLVPALAERAGDTDVASFAWMFATYSAAKIASQPVGGVLVDRVGSRAVLLSGLGLYALAMGGLVFPSPLAGIATLRALEGAAEGLVYPAVLTAVRERTTESDIGRKLGLVLAIGSSGMLLGPVLGALLRDVGLEWPLLVASSVAIAVAIGNARFVRGTASAPKSRTVRGELAKIYAAMRDPDVSLPALPIAHNKLAISGFLALFPISVVHDFGAPPARVAVLFLVVGIVFGVTQPLAGWIVDRYSPRLVVSLLLLPVLVSCAALALPRTLAAFSPVLAGNVALQSIVFTGVLKQVSVAKGARDAYGGVIGSVATLTDLATIAGPLVVLRAYPHIGVLVFPLVASTGILFHVPYLLHAIRARSRAA
jgi:MFS family permease